MTICQPLSSKSVSFESQAQAKLYPGASRQRGRAEPQGNQNSATGAAEGTMTDLMRDEPGTPKIVDRATFQAELDALRVREKAHTHEGDAIAAARRRFPMVEVDASTPLIGERGTVTLLDAFEGRRQLV